MAQMNPIKITVTIIELTNIVAVATLATIIMLTITPAEFLQ